MPPVVPVNQNCNSETQKTTVLHYSMLNYSKQLLAESTLISSKYTHLHTTPHNQVQRQCQVTCKRESHTYTPSGQTGLLLQTSNYELFNCNNFNIRYWSWNYRGCWHQTCPPIDFAKGFGFNSLQSRIEDPVRYFLSLPPRVGIG